MAGRLEGWNTGRLEGKKEDAHHSSNLPTFQPSSHPTFHPSTLPSLRPATWDDYDFLWRLVRTTMREHVQRLWPWDDTWQKQYFRLKFDPTQKRIVVLDGQDIGVMTVERRDDELYLSEFYILPDHQRLGIGTHLLKELLAEAAQQALPVSLRVLKGNPALRFYQRLDFRIVDATDTHYIMRREYS